MRRWSRAQRPDAGVAMVMAIVWSALLMVLSLLVGQAVIATIRPSDANEISFRALSAAEAGVADYRARLARVNTPSKVTSAALTSWVPMPGGTQSAYYTYSLIRDTSLNAGEIRLRSTGWYAGVTRTVDAILRKRTTYDYAYVSALETVPWDFPGAYTGSGGQMTPEQAREVCNQEVSTAGGKDLPWWSPAPKTAASLPNRDGPHRNSLICKYIAVKSGDRWIGNVHTNDVWYFNGDLSQSFQGRVSTSCPTGNGSTGCPDTQRWINVETLTGSTYLPFEMPTGGTPVAWNPQFESALELPSAPTALKELAASSGCYFRGPTRMRWHPGGKVVVTSPDTPTGSVKSFCLESGKTTYLATSPTSQPTMVLDISTMVSQGFNGVFYVDDGQGVATDLPSCKVKTKTIAPFVIPSPPSQYAETNTYDFPPSQNLWTSGETGFPVSPKTGDTWSDGMCSRGSVYIQGAYKGQVTVGSAHDIVITGQLWDEELRNANWTTPGPSTSPDPTYGVPPTTSLNAMALVPNRYLYVYLPDANAGGNAWNETNLNNLAINASAVILNRCFAVQQWDTTVQRGQLKFVGSLGQKYRCTIEKESGLGGYKPFIVYYDDRLRNLVAPPGVSDLFTEPYRLVRIVEVNPSVVTGLPSAPR